MTAVIHHGPPGSYKTFALVQRVIVPALQSGRTVCHNIRGLDNVDRIAKAMGVQFPEGAQLMAVAHDSQEGFDYMGRFFHWAPAGALIVMDEGQRVYPTRLRSLGEFDRDTSADDENAKPKRPTSVENAFDQHRHMNWDIYISTTNVSKIHKEVRSVVEYAFRHRDLSGVLPWYKNKWIEFKHDAESSGKATSHYIGKPVQYSADPNVFNCYQSTATGKAKASSENKSIFSDNRVRFLLAVAFLAIVYFLSLVGDTLARFKTPTDVQLTPPGASLSVSDHHDPAGTGGPIATANLPDLSVGQLRATFRKKNPYFSDPDVYDLPPSKEYWLAGVIEGPQDIALIADVWRTYRVPLRRACFLDRPTKDWVCFFRGDVVASYTGPIEKRLENDEQEQPIANLESDTVNF